MYIANTVTVGGLATKGGYYTSEQGAGYQSITDGFIAPDDGYVRFCCQDNTLTETSFGIYADALGLLSDEIEKIGIILSDLENNIIIQSSTNCNTQEGITGWEVNGGTASLSFDSSEKAMVVSASERFHGAKIKKQNDNPDNPRVVIFQAKGISGDYSNIGFSYATYPLPNDNRIELSDEWKWYIIQMPTDGTNKFMTILTYNDDSFVIKVRSVFLCRFPFF